ncbi:MAG: hypothetical protein ACLQFT_03835 [Steroidobacteraceae bacterium]|jgi:hypothetical protein
MHIEQIEQIEAVLNAINWKPSIRVCNAASKSGVFTGACAAVQHEMHGVQGVPSSNLGAPTSLKQALRATLRNSIP